MKKLKAVFFVCVSACIAGCFENCCDDCTYSEEKLPAYANKSGETVKIIMERIGNSYEKSITNGDTLHYTAEEWFVSGYVGCGSISFEICYMPIRMELHFLNAQKCLIFDGPIKNDGIDMRSWDSYKKGNEIIELWDGFTTYMEYVYTITPEHKAMATEEECQGSASE